MNPNNSTYVHNQDGLTVHFNDGTGVIVNLNPKPPNWDELELAGGSKDVRDRWPFLIYCFKASSLPTLPAEIVKKIVTMPQVVENYYTALPLHLHHFGKRSCHRMSFLQMKRQAPNVPIEFKSFVTCDGAPDYCEKQLKDMMTLAYRFGEIASILLKRKRNAAPTLRSRNVHGRLDPYAIAKDLKLYVDSIKNITRVARDRLSWNSDGGDGYESAEF